jgi:hypothetical protein
MELRIVSVDENVAVATLGNIVFCHFRQLTPSSAIAVVRRAFTSLKGPVVFFGVIETTSTPPDERAREAFIKLFDEFGERIAAALVTIRGDGFRAAMVRVIASGILNFIRFRVRFPKHIGGSLEEAASRAAEHASGLDAAAIMSGFHHLSRA